MSFRLAAYAVCIEQQSVLLVRQASGIWSLPGGKVEHGEDPIDAVIREVAEETGCCAVVERLLGVDSRVIPAAERIVPGDSEHHNIGIYYSVRLAGGQLRPEANGETIELSWTALSRVNRLTRSSLVDVGLSLKEILPADGHVPSIPVIGLVQH
ncbi:NUDIX hydrolase [Falsochrobactrum shanghaiense]|uniref:NUDIX hydrolase n=1 Tax=Falsochrobactrum shanghaiense TaxID=2201899 RepID=A0A316J5E3_9HYPH|nr:NUDIX domain-containing protein [Falsochrobactrum shanghaiense]PWL16541.1 NUDIX hydrolase [Falsochrobactrum shanghaiense]